jgi:hypothetical protein
MNIDPDRLISITDLARKTSKFVNEIADTDETYLVLKENKLTAALVSYERFRGMTDRLEALSRRSRRMPLVEPNWRLDAGEPVDLYEVLGVPRSPNLLEAGAVVWRHWLRNEGSSTVHAPIGVDDRNSPTHLELTGSSGAHSAVVGGTPTARSEVLVALVSCLASRYSPEDLTFALADYTGDPTEAPFYERHFGAVGLPHTALRTADPSCPEFLDALTAEIEARRAILSQYPGGGDYRRRRRDVDYHLPAMPFLVVVLVTSDSTPLPTDLVRGLLALARLGRSLGVHLLISAESPESLEPELKAQISTFFDVHSDKEENPRGGIAVTHTSSVDGQSRQVRIVTPTAPVVESGRTTSQSVQLAEILRLAADGSTATLVSAQASD